MRIIAKAFILAAIALLLGCFFLFMQEEANDLVEPPAQKESFINAFPSDNDPVQFMNVIQTASTRQFVYSLDQRRNAVYQYDINGNYLNTIGRPGQGPGDLSAPLSISVDDSALYIYEQAKMHIQKFDHSGNYLEAISFNGAFEDIQIVDSLIWMSNFYLEGFPVFSDMPEIEKKSVFTILNHNKKTFSAAGRYPDIYDQLGWRRGNVLIAQFNHKIYAAYPLLNFIDVFDASTGEQMQTIKLQQDELADQYELLKEGKIKDTPEFIIRSISVNKKGILLPIFGEEMKIFHFGLDGDFISQINFGELYERAENDFYIRDLESIYMPETGKLRLFANIYSDFPKTVIVDIN